MDTPRVQIQGPDGAWEDVPGITSVEISYDEPPTDPDALTLQVCAIITRRLVRLRDLTHEQAALAALQLARRQDGPHVDLAREEVAAILDDMAQAMAPFLEAFRRMGEAVIEAAQALQPAVETMPARVQVHLGRAAERQRPAWQSPYGPQHRRHRA